MRPSHWFHTLRLRLRSIFCRGQVERELAEEFQYHLDMKTEGLIAAGMQPDEAAQAALRTMGGLEQRKEECRDARKTRWVDELRQDVRYALRILARNPGFTIVAVLMLALGIGANTAIVGTIDALVFRQMPFAQIDRLVTIKPGANFPNYLDLRADDRVFSGVAAYMGLPLEARTPASDLVSGRGVSANFFQVLGLHMALGRGFLPEEEKLAGSRPVVVISHRLWKRSFSSDPAVVGKLLRLNGEPLMIVGVAPEHFRDVVVGSSKDVWVPFPMFARITHLEKEPEWRESIERRDMGPWLTVIARLKPAVTLQEARARIEVFAADLDNTYPGSTKNWKPTVVPESRARWPEGNALFFSTVLSAAGLCLLLITCTNVANLLLARGSARQREIATRLALGAGRGRLVRQLLAEGLTLSALALIVSLLVCRWTIRLLPAFEDSIGSTFSLVLGIDRRVLFFAISIGLLTNLMFGLAPAFVVSRTDLTGALKNQGFLSYRRRRIPWRRALVVLQMGLTVILLMAAGLFMRTVWHFETIDPGFDRNVLLLGSDFILSGGFEIGTADAERQALAFYRGVLEQVRELPGIRSASWAEDLPFDRRGYIEESVRPEESEDTEANWLSLNCNVISAGYFKTLGIPIVQGRDFRGSDNGNPTGTVIVNETLSRRYWPGRSPLGRRIRVRDRKPELWEVVGVAKDISFSTPWDEAQPYVYFPYWQLPLYLHMDLQVSTAGDPRGAIKSITDACTSVNPKVIMNNPRLMSQRTESILSQDRAAAFVLTVFGSLALVLAAIGLYGIISYSVVQRTHEFGIRVALGARKTDILKQVILEAMVLVTLGLAIGLPCFMAMSRLLYGRMHGLNPFHPGIYVIVPSVSFAVALLAVALPARRASADPMNALRIE
jgi:macrolide transport system ATP-binding/permease protein